MRTLTLLCVTLLTVSPGRGVRLLAPDAAEEMPARFDPAQSAALFVGVREFPGDRTLPPVEYAADDAVDLAWTFALDERVRLVQPHRVVLALSGAPRKNASRDRLRELLGKGAHLAPADGVAALLEQQARAVGSGGVLIAAFASHGFSSEGTSYVLEASSVFGRRETSLSTARLLEIAGTAPRSLVILDACRQRQGARAPGIAAPAVLEGITESAGQAVISISGEYAWDANGNGALTAAILDGLRCKAPADVRGVVSFETLRMYVEKRLLTWIRRYRDPHAATATEALMQGKTNLLPLAACSPVPFPPIGRIAWTDRTLIAYTEQGAELWRRTLDGPITLAEAADLDGDQYNEAIAAVGSMLVVYRPTGEAWWSTDTNVPVNYDTGAAMRVTRFVTGDLFRKKRRQIIALSVDENGAPASRLSVVDPDGTARSGYFHPGRLLDVTVAAETARHAPKIIAIGVNDALHQTLNLRGRLGSVFMLDPKKVSGEAPPYRGKLRSGTQLWYGYVEAPSIERLEIMDRDNDGNRDIALATASGRVHVDFAGRIIEAQVPFGLVK